jgi:transcriptional regulator of acetoin/glycerol metabolism
MTVLSKNHATTGREGSSSVAEPRRDTALAEAFLRASRSHDAVLAVNEAVVMATSGAADFVTAADHAALWAWARAQWTGSGMLSLEGRPAVNARCVPVCVGPQLAGALVILRSASVSDSVHPFADSSAERSFEFALPGASALARHTRGQLEHCSLQRANTLITGEPGTGKAVVGRQLLAEVGEQIFEFDASCSFGDGWIVEVTTALGEHSRVLLTHLDEVAPGMVPALAKALGERRQDCWVAATAARAGVPESLADAFPKTVMLPALRDRLEDLPAIAAQLLSRHTSRGITKRLGTEARRLLWSHNWPDNLAELELVLRNAVAAANTAVIDTHCIRLPKNAALLGRRRSALEAAERFALLDALDRCDGNKLAAADLLGIARSTLYRKLRALGIDSEIGEEALAGATA